MYVCALWVDSTPNEFCATSGRVNLKIIKSYIYVYFFPWDALYVQQQIFFPRRVLKNEDRLPIFFNQKES